MYNQLNLACMKKENNNNNLRQLFADFFNQQLKPEEIQWLEEQQVLDWLRISRSTLYRLRQNQLIFHCKMGGRILYPKELIHKFMLNKTLGSSSF